LNGNSAPVREERRNASPGTTSKFCLSTTSRPQWPNLDADLAWHLLPLGRWCCCAHGLILERFYTTIDEKPTVAYLWARTVSARTAARHLWSRRNGFAEKPPSAVCAYVDEFRTRSA
jgi:hypothetical protein